MSGTMKLDEIEIIAYKKCWLHLVTKLEKSGGYITYFPCFSLPTERTL